MPTQDTPFCFFSLAFLPPFVFLSSFPRHRMPFPFMYPPSLADLHPRNVLCPAPPFPSSPHPAMSCPREFRERFLASMRFFVHCVGIVFRHPTFVHFPKLHSGSNRLFITPDFIRILFVKCASRQARVSLSSISGQSDCPLPSGFHYTMITKLRSNC